MFHRICAGKFYAWVFAAHKLVNANINGFLMTISLIRLRQNRLSIDSNTVQNISSFCQFGNSQARGIRACILPCLAFKRGYSRRTQRSNIHHQVSEIHTTPSSNGNFSHRKNIFELLSALLHADAKCEGILPSYEIFTIWKNGDLLSSRTYKYGRNV